MDFGCGNGGFLLKANNSTKMAEGVELEKRLKDHFIKNNLNVWENLDEVLNLSEMCKITNLNLTKNLFIYLLN